MPQRNPPSETPSAHAENPRIPVSQPQPKGDKPGAAPVEAVRLVGPADVSRRSAELRTLLEQDRALVWRAVEENAEGAKMIRTTIRTRSAVLDGLSKDDWALIADDFPSHTFGASCGDIRAIDALTYSRRVRVLTE